MGNHWYSALKTLTQTEVEIDETDKNDKNCPHDGHLLRILPSNKDINAVSFT